MSYPAISQVLAARSLDPLTATDHQLSDALWEAFEVDLPLGVSFLRNQATVVRTTNNRQLSIEDPGSPLGRQLIRLVGCDVSRAVCETKLRVAMGIYNCCSPVLAPTREMLGMSLIEQIQLQNGTLASADC